MAMAMAMAMAMTMASDDAMIISHPSKVFARRVPKRVRVGGREAENGTHGVGVRHEREHAEQPRLVALEVVMSHEQIARLEARGCSMQACSALKPIDLTKRTTFTFTSSRVCARGALRALRASFE